MPVNEKREGFCLDKLQYLDFHPVCSALLAEIASEFIRSWTNEEATVARDKYVSLLVAKGCPVAKAEAAWRLVVQDGSGYVGSVGDVGGKGEEVAVTAGPVSGNRPHLLLMANREPAPVIDQSTMSNENVFCFEHGRWVLRFDGQTIYPQDISGIKYLHFLISSPGKSFSPQELYDGFGSRARKKPKAVTVQEAFSSRLGLAPAQSDVLIDQRGRGEMLDRMEKIEIEMARAKSIPNADLIEKLAAERIAIKEQLRKAFTPVGSRRIQEPELVRRVKAIDIAIRRAKEKIQRAGHQDLLNHLNDSIDVKVKSGCVYMPSVETPWRTQSVQFVLPSKPR
jgi:hypothetical protein